jgi:hypothetical protein
LKPPLSDFLLADVNTERLLKVPVFLHKRESARRARELQIATCSQHWSLAYDDLKKCDGDLAHVGATREDFVGATAEVARSQSVSFGLAEAQGHT